MDFKLKTYQKVKIKQYFKNNQFFFLFHAAKLNSTKWIVIEQNLKKLKLNYYKPLNKIGVKILKSSVFRNVSSNIAGFILFVNVRSKNTILNLPYLVKSLKSSFILIAIKLNNKIYSRTQIKGLEDLCYKKSAFNFYKVLDKHLKTSYVLTNKKTTSK